MEPKNDNQRGRTQRDMWTPLRMGDLSPEDIRRAKILLDRIPELPVSVHQVLKLTADPKTSSQDIAEIVSSDPVLVSNILMMVNSSYYGINRKIDNLRLAIVLLGFNEVRSIAIRSGFSNAVKRIGAQTGYDTSNLWAHSYLVSSCSEWFAGDDDPQRAGMLLTLGLLHDIGKFALYTLGIMMKDRGVRPHSEEAVPPDAHLLEKEEILFGVNHPIIGGMLARKWNLSERICASIEYHHHPSFFGGKDIPSDFTFEIAAACISDLIVNRMENSDIHLKTPHPMFFEQLGIEPQLDRAVNPELADRLERARAFIAEIG